MNVHQLTEEILQCLYVYFSYSTNHLTQATTSQPTSNSRFHPDFHNAQSQLQREMLQCVRDWLSKSKNEYSIIQRLSKESVRNHKNLRLEGEGGAPASQGSFAEQEAHQFQNSVAGYIPGAGLFSGNAKGLEGGSPGYPGRPGGYPQVEGQQHGGFPGAPVYPGGPVGGGGHQHGGDRYESTSTYTPPAAAPSHATTYPMSGHGGDRYESTSAYTPPAAAPSHATTYPMSGGGPPPLPSPHSGPAHHHDHSGPHTQHGGYTASFPSSNAFPGPGQGGDGFSFPGSGTASFPGGKGVPYPETSFPGASSFPDGRYPGPPGGGYEAPLGPPHHGGYNPHGSDGSTGGYHAPSGPPVFPNSGGYGGTSQLEFPGANPSAGPKYNSEYPDGYNPSYQGRGW
jgi:hypothetical protein